MFEILDAILATAAVILGLSLIVQAIQQIVKQIFDLKSSYMKVELLALFSDAGERQRFVVNFLPLGLLSRLADSYSRRIVSELEERLSTFGFTDLHLLEDVDAQKLKEMVLGLPVARDASLQDRLEEVLNDIEKWFEISKTAFQEHYERRMRLWSVIISGVVVIGVNANLIDTYREFSGNKTLRDAAVVMGQRLTAMPRDSMLVRVVGQKKDSLLAKDSAGSIGVSDIRSEVDSIVTFLDDRSFQVMGWTELCCARLVKYSFWQNVSHMFIGWTGMILMVSVGAPFWYDFFKTVLGLKNQVRAGTTARQDPS